MAIKNTKIVQSIPAVTAPNTEYLVQAGDKYHHFHTDNNNVLRQLEVEAGENLLKHSPIMMSLDQVTNTGKNNAYVTTRLWDYPSVYGMWQGAINQAGSEWGVHSISRLLNHDSFKEDLTNKEITVSVDVMPGVYDIIVGLNPLGKTEMPFTAKAGKWTRIYTTVSKVARLPGIVAKMKNNADHTGNHNALINHIYYKDWKVEYGKIMTPYSLSPFDLGSKEVSYVKTHKLSNPSAFNTSQAIEGRFQDGIQIGLSSTNTTITMSYFKYTFRCKYIFLKNNSTVTFNGISQFISNSPEGNVFRGNRGDSIELTYFQDENNRMLAKGYITRLQDESAFVIPITATTSLNASHVGRVLQFNNTGNINIDITNLPSGATVSGVKNNTGIITFTGTTAPTSNNVLNGAVNSSFSLVKNASGVSNLLINNK